MQYITRKFMFTLHMIDERTSIVTLAASAKRHKGQSIAKSIFKVNSIDAVKNIVGSSMKIASGMRQRRRTIRLPL